MTELEMYLEAGDIARYAMGRIPHGPGRRSADEKVRWQANEDPLAWWLLTETIVAFGKRARLKKARRAHCTIS